MTQQALPAVEPPTFPCIRCGAGVRLAPDTRELVASCNLALGNRGDYLLSADEVVTCGPGSACYAAWSADRTAATMAARRDEQSMAGMADPDPRPGPDR